MLIPTNDAFVGMDSIEIPTEPGTYTYYLNAYDAGTDLRQINAELNGAYSDVKLRDRKRAYTVGDAQLERIVKWLNTVPRESALLRR